MTSEEGDRQQERDLEQLQHDIRASRKFSLADAIAQSSSGFLKGDSPVPQLVQAKAKIENFILHHLSDSSGALENVLQNWATSKEVQIAENLNQPLLVLRDTLKTLCDRPEVLYEFVRQVDMIWGQTNDERPHFQRPGQKPHPEDEYTHESVRRSLADLLVKLEAELAGG